ncbi:MAG: hypothetical protein GY874_02115 [Desulfobacteraceae bacterium]|nr:hypothetical protein [Desulfobacteraceae bacterium]
MTRPIHSIEHIKATYKKYQMIALVCTSISIIAVLLSTLSNCQLSRLYNKNIRSATSSNNQSIAKLNRDMNSLREKLSKITQRLEIEKSNVAALKSRSNELEKKLIIEKAKTKPQPGDIQEIELQPGVVQETEPQPGVVQETEPQPGVVQETEPQPEVVQ